MFLYLWEYKDKVTKNQFIMAVIQAKICAVLLLAASSGMAQAQFNTLRRKDFTGYEIINTRGKELPDTVGQTLGTPADSVTPEVSPVVGHTVVQPSGSEKCGVRKKHLGFDTAKAAYPDGPGQNDAADCTPLPELTIANLLAEIRSNGIRHEKVVLAQAILETGWFTSSVCRHRNNLFGLTNPRTGQYYEFCHWTESVRAYRDKVQYRYKGGNYLLWLKEIGYAEDPRYVSSLIRILRQYMM